MNEEPDPHPLKPPVRRPYELKDDDDGYWTRPSLLDRYGNLSFKGRMRWLGGILIGVNLLALCFGFVWVKLLGLGIAALLLGLLLPESMND